MNPIRILFLVILSLMTCVPYTLCSNPTITVQFFNTSTCTIPNPLPSLYYPNATLQTGGGVTRNANIVSTGCAYQNVPSPIGINVGCVIYPDGTGSKGFVFYNDLGCGFGVSAYASAFVSCTPIDNNYGPPAFGINSMIITCTTGLNSSYATSTLSFLLFFVLTVFNLVILS